MLFLSKRIKFTLQRRQKVWEWSWTWVGNCLRQNFQMELPFVSQLFGVCACALKIELRKDILHGFTFLLIWPQWKFIEQFIYRKTTLKPIALRSKIFQPVKVRHFCCTVLQANNSQFPFRCYGEKCCHFYFCYTKVLVLVWL